MKLLTLNFLTCARKSCKASTAAFPLSPREAELERTEIPFNLPFLKNILPRLEWDAIRKVSQELQQPELPAQIPETETLVDGNGEPTQISKDLHTLLMETEIKTGSLRCNNCNHEYAIMEGIANFLLPSHLV